VERRIDAWQVLATAILGLPILMWAANRDPDHRNIPWASRDDRAWSIDDVPIGASENTLASGVVLRTVSEIAHL
jgi:hypothetical protein